MLSSELWIHCGISLYQRFLYSSRKFSIFDILCIICNKIKKYRKCLRKGPIEKDLTFFSTEW